MYCKLKDKEVFVYVLKDIIIDSNKVQLKDCTGNYKCNYNDIPGKKVYIQCDMIRHEGCLLNKYDE